MNPAAISDRVLSGDRREAARLITRIEMGDETLAPVLKDLYLKGGKAKIVGVTGPPGTGKSTLVDGLICAWRNIGKRVAVLAVDPTSPLTGGAVLGDRVRMGRHAADPDVLIRSMASRGALGGLAHAAGDALTVLDALGFDLIVLETVGVGQSEVEVLTHSDVVVVLQTPEGGDGIQAVKAGVLEIADILVVNKADIGGVDRMIRNLREMVAHRSASMEGWQTPVFATEANRNEGISEVVAAIDAFFACRDAGDDRSNHRALRLMRARVFALAQDLLRRHVLRDEQSQQTSALIADTVARKIDPHSAARRLVAQMTKAEADR